MKSTKDWVSGLNISEQEFAAWLRMAPSQDSLTFWCVETGKVDAQKYLEWARNFYGLASINSDFFDQENNSEFWLKIQSVANWSAELAPIGEWDNTVFIACVEPRPEVKWSFPVRYILALPSDLKKYWSGLQATAEKSFVGIPITPDKQNTITGTKAPPLDSPALTVVASAPPTPPIVISKPTGAPKAVPMAPTPIKIVTQAPPKPTVVSPAAPPSLAPELAGLNLDALQAIPAVKDRDYMAELSSEVKKSADNVDLSAPDNLNWKPDPKNQEEALVPDGIVLSFDQAAPTESHEGAQSESAAPSEAVLAMNEGDSAPPDLSIRESSVARIELPEEVISFETSTPLDSVAKELPTHIGSVDSLSIAAETSAPTPIAVAPIDISKPTPIASVTTKTATPAATSSAAFIPMLNEFRAAFQGGMVLEINTDNFTPIVWDDGFKPKSSEAQKVWNLNPPSAFRVAFRTGLPYLGQVVETPLNREFFTAWGFDNLPRVVLVHPIKVNDKPTHLMVCISDGLKKNHLLLSEGDRLAGLFLNILSQKKAAA